jgi:hypothetical protein
MRRKNHKSLVFHFKVINKLINYYSQHKHIDKIDFIYNKLLACWSLFWGEPLNGLQIMGV